MNGFRVFMEGGGYGDAIIVRFGGFLVVYCFDTDSFEICDYILSFR